MDEIIPIRISRIIDINLSIKSLINDIKSYKGSVEELKKLNALGREKISNLRKCIDELEIYANEQIDSVVRNKLLDATKIEKDQLSRILKDFQAANVECMLSIEKKNTDELLAMSNPEEILRRRNSRNQSTLLQQNTRITDNMSSISRQLADVIKQSTEALETLVKSSTNITGMQKELKTTGILIDSSGKILNKYQQREFTDKILIIFSFAFFIACVFYVVYCRI